MREIKAPKFVSDKDPNRMIFLAGSIEMGEAENWQDKVVRSLKETNYTILNPRRDDWDSSWEQSIDNEQFREQVEWELQGLEQADSIILYFDPKTKSPISLLEFGLFARRGAHKLLVVCPDGFWRKGNVDIVCVRYDVPQFESLGAVIEELKREERGVPAG